MLKNAIMLTYVKKCNNVDLWLKYKDKISLSWFYSLIKQVALSYALDRWTILITDKKIK